MVSAEGEMLRSVDELQRKAGKLSKFDAAILEFARRWLPYGGPPPDEIWVEFGMSTRRYEQHLLTMLDTVTSRNIPSNDRATLRAQLVEKRLPRRMLSRPALTG
jgi:hypothetical protein